MTIKDIAKECGCAVGTVSRVLNNQPYVSESMRSKVLEVVAKYDFVLNKNARDLKSRVSKTIVIIVKGTNNMLFYNILEVIQKRIEKLPYNTSVVILDEYDNRIVGEYSNEAQCALNIYYEKKPLGFIFLGGNPERFNDDFQKIKVPCILITTKPKKEGFENLSSVSTDEFQASLYVARYLVKKGHSKIGLIGGDFESSETSKNRYNGFIEGLELAGLDFDFENSYVTTRYSFEGGAAAAEELIAKYPGLTAIFCMSDVMAIGACCRLKQLGYSVPGDISIIGFDGLPIADFYCPRITTIKQSSEDLAIQGLKTFIDCVEKKSSAVHKIIPFEFIEGESVKAIAGK
ncbi:LacI family DNA-binding transcriptional regulator [Treponema sp.]|uniref:LacI family DNA-binding transcriptional regulator n=1 Tax=Treponema sp. TaxID=166 RepID=UPI003F0F0AE6